MNWIAFPTARQEAEQSIETPLWYDPAKRAMDVVMSLGAMVIFLPLWIAIGLAIRATSRGPVLYVADTMGKNGRVFRLYKFRTMYADGDEARHKEYLARFVLSNEPHTVLRQRNGDAQKIYKIINDPRVTSIGRFLRATGLDEAPQFINVLKGEMSVVGPRPPRPAEYEHYSEWHKRRVTVMPGITGLYQVTARSVVPFEEMVCIDLEYVRRRSLWLDLEIMLRTVQVMVLRKGGY